MNNEVINYFSIRTCIFQVTANDQVYSESLPPDLLGAKLLDYKPDKIDGKIYIVNFPNAKGAAVSKDTLSLHGNFPDGDRAVSKQLSVGIVNSFIAKILEENYVYHIFCSAVYIPSSDAILLLVGEPKTRKSQLVAMVTETLNAKLVTNSCLAFSRINWKYKFFKGPSEWLFRPDVIRKAPKFFSGLRKTKDKNIPKTVFQDAEKMEAYDVNTRMITDVAIPSRLYIAWPRYGKYDMVQDLSPEISAKFLLEDTNDRLFKLTDMSVPGGILPKGWDPSKSEERESAISNLTSSATRNFEIVGSDETIKDYLIAVFT